MCKEQELIAQFKLLASKERELDERMKKHLLGGEKAETKERPDVLKKHRGEKDHEDD